jgi:hypothetical protein
MNKIPLHRDTVASRIEEASLDIERQIKLDIGLCDYYSIALDESTDIGDTAQLAVFIRFILPDFVVREELLGLVGLKGNTTGSDIKCALVQLLETHNIEPSKLAAVTTDGAPSMIGRYIGAVTLLRQENCFPNFLSYHCLIHQEALCAKQMKTVDIMRIVSDIVCFIRAKALHHRQFKNLLVELGSEKGDVILHADVRWLSRANVLCRFCELLREIRLFLNSKNKQYDELSDPGWLLQLAFLTDIAQHLNVLNKQLQGEGNTLPVMYQSIEAFQRKLSLFSAHIATKNLTHFSHLSRMVADVDPCHTVYNEQAFGEIIDGLAQEFEKKFSECLSAKPLFQFVIDPFSFSPDTMVEFVQADQVAASQLSLLELQSDLYLSTSSNVFRKDCISMWKTISAFPAYNVICDVARRVLSMFGSTYRCESVFSAMKGIKSKERNRITDTHLMHCLRAVTTKYIPSFALLVQAKQCHGSH